LIVFGIKVIGVCLLRLISNQKIKNKMMIRMRSIKEKRIKLKWRKKRKLRLKVRKVMVRKKEK
jgi:hypothetical protein